MSHSQKQTYNKHYIQSLIKFSCDHTNIAIDDLKKAIEQEVDKAIERKVDNALGSEFLQKIIKKVKEDNTPEPFTIEMDRFKIDIKEKDYEFSTNPEYGGLIFSFSTEDEIRISADVFLSTRPGVDINLGVKYSQVSLSAGVGIELIMHTLTIKKHNTNLPYVAAFGMIKCDVYFEGWKIFGLYKYSKWPLLGSDHSAGIGISKLIH